MTVNRLEDRYNFDWLPGFREMTACQENNSQKKEPSGNPEMPGKGVVFGNEGTMETRDYFGNEETAGMRSYPGNEGTTETRDYFENGETTETRDYFGNRETTGARSYSGNTETPGSEGPVENGTQQEMPGGNNQDISEEMNMLPPEKLQQEEQKYWQDLEYMIRMLPAAAKEIWAVADALLDRYEFEGSSMYAEYPDKNAVLKIVDMIYEKLKYYEKENTESKTDGSVGKNHYYVSPEERGEQTPFRHLILVILCWNMEYRRQRYQRRKKIFPLS